MSDKIILQTMAADIESFVSAMSKAKRISGFTNAQIAERSGVPLQNINKMLGGYLGEPKLYNTVAICKLLSFSLDEHFGIAASADSRIGNMVEEREQTIAHLQDHIESLKAENRSKDLLLQERADYLRLKDSYIQQLISYITSKEPGTEVNALLSVLAANEAKT